MGFTCADSLLTLQDPVYEDFGSLFTSYSLIESIVRGSLETVVYNSWDCNEADSNRETNYFFQKIDVENNDSPIGQRLVSGTSDLFTVVFDSNGSDAYDITFRPDDAEQKGTYQLI